MIEPDRVVAHKTQKNVYQTRVVSVHLVDMDEDSHEELDAFTKMMALTNMNEITVEYALSSVYLLRKSSEPSKRDAQRIRDFLGFGNPRGYGYDEYEDRWVFMPMPVIVNIEEPLVRMMEFLFGVLKAYAANSMFEVIQYMSLEDMKPKNIQKLEVQTALMLCKSVFEVCLFRAVGLRAYLVSRVHALPTGSDLNAPAQGYNIDPAIMHRINEVYSRNITLLRNQFLDRIFWDERPSPQYSDGHAGRPARTWNKWKGVSGMHDEPEWYDAHSDDPDPWCAPSIGDEGMTAILLDNTHNLIEWTPSGVAAGRFRLTFWRVDDDTAARFNFWFPANSPFPRAPIHESKRGNVAAIAQLEAAWARDAAAAGEVRRPNAADARGRKMSVFL